eukprot:Protomagalhaensia_wolfi_Nauph_80__4333@NODE_4429_length_572_cov_17_170732_g3542_i0_p2_GENE_NODE_4429_length_572_cov_17_170732_g3542_i0NODE_4429_length_572_cov_17_170732_g3542_i0_p2_ORF_typecomplete_len105_score5_79zfP11/PF03854_14/0_005_NODE_4429_length_572_cov_17_170732_g3542_i0189503
MAHPQSLAVRRRVHKNLLKFCSIHYICFNCFSLEFSSPPFTPFHGFMRVLITSGSPLDPLVVIQLISPFQIPISIHVGNPLDFGLLLGRLRLLTLVSIFLTPGG